MEQEETNKEKVERIVVVNELPVQQVSSGKIGDEEVSLITIADALTIILEKITKIEKSVG